MPAAAVGEDVEVRADPRGDSGALARIGVERLDPGERAGVHRAEILASRLNVRPALLDREGTISRHAR